MNDKIFIGDLENLEENTLPSLNGNYSGSGDNWRDFAIDDSNPDLIYIYTIVKHDSAEPSSNFAEQSTSILNGINLNKTKSQNYLNLSMKILKY